MILVMITNQVVNTMIVVREFNLFGLAIIFRSLFFPIVEGFYLKPNDISNNPGLWSGVIFCYSKIIPAQ